MMATVPTMCHTVEMALNQPISRVDTQFSSPWQTRIPAEDDGFRGRGLGFGVYGRRGSLQVSLHLHIFTSKDTDPVPVVAVSASSGPFTLLNGPQAVQGHFHREPRYFSAAAASEAAQAAGRSTLDGSFAQLLFTVVSKRVGSHVMMSVKWV